MIFSCSEPKQKSVVINSVEQLSDKSFVVYLDQDSSLIREFYRIDSISYGEGESKIDLYQQLKNTGQLTKKECFSKNDTLCYLLEEYGVVENGINKRTKFYKSSKISKVVYFIANEKTIVFSQSYDEKGFIVETLIDLYVDVKEIPGDSMCVNLKQIGSELMFCEFEYFADANFTDKDSLYLKNVTVDSKKGVGQICLKNDFSQSEIHVVGEINLDCENTTPKLLQFAKVININ